jgi:hypothetical protein
LIVTFAATAARYTTICESALRRLTLQEEEYADLLDNPRGPQWRDAVLAAHLQRTLGISYVPFVQIVQRLEQGITKFANRLQLDVENGLQPEWLTPRGYDSFRTRMMSKLNRLLKSINIGLENDRMNRSLTKIEDDLRRLESLLSLNAATTEDASRMRSRKSAIWEVVREGAEGMFDVISCHWKCFCASTHQASLKLEPRESDQIKGRTVQFQLVFLFDKSPALQPQPPWTWKDIKINCQEDEAKKARLAPAAPDPLKPPKLPSHSQHSVSSQKVKSVRISTITAAFPSINTSGKLTSLQISSAQAGKVHDLCKTLSSHIPSGTCLGIIEDAYWRYQLFGGIPLAGSPIPAKSLRECFASWSNHVRPANSQHLTQPEK